MTRSRNDGFTLIEATIILLALGILAGILIPSIGGFNSMARRVRVKEDLGVLCSMMKVMLDDLGASAFFDARSYGRRGDRGGYGSVGGAAAGTAGGQMTMTQSTASGGDWCIDCDMSASDCGDDCRDDCRQGCNHGQRPVGVTTQTWSYQAGTQANAAGYGSSYRTGSGASAYGSGYGLRGWPLGLLVGAGDIPASAIGPSEWQLEVGSIFTQTSSGLYPTAVSFAVGALDDQLVHGDPSFLGYGNSSAYGAGRGVYGGYASTYRPARNFVLGAEMFRWRGPYVADGVSPDPWGNRYMANVFGLHVPQAGTYPARIGYDRYVELFSSAVVCYSAGPDETIQTEFNQPFGWYTGGDDITVVLAGAGGIR